MPAIHHSQKNGFIPETGQTQLETINSNCDQQRGDCFQGNEEKIGAALANRKMQLLEEDACIRSNGINKAQQQKQRQYPDCEVFLDTQTLGAHTANKQHSSDQDEPILVFDTQNNTSISQTAKDQFAAALLRLQSGLDQSEQRLNAIETKVDDLVRQQKQQMKLQQSKAVAKSAGPVWLNALSGRGHLGTLLYLSWPVLVFVALRTIERRNSLNKLVA